MPSNHIACCPEHVQNNIMKVSLNEQSDDISILTFAEGYYDLDTILTDPNTIDLNMNHSNIDQNYIEYKISIKGLPDDYSFTSNCTQFFDCQENSKAFHLSIDYQILGEYVKGE